MSRRAKSSSGSSCFMDRFGIGTIPPERHFMDIVAISALWASVKIDIYRGFFDMTKVAVLEIERCMASSAAITHDVLATANRIGAAKGAPPFEVTTVRCGSRRSSADLRGSELVIVPGLGTPSAGGGEGTGGGGRGRRPGGGAGAGH